MIIMIKANAYLQGEQASIHSSQKIKVFVVWILWPDSICTVLPPYLRAFQLFSHTNWARQKIWSNGTRVSIHIPFALHYLINKRYFKFDIKLSKNITHPIREHNRLMLCVASIRYSKYKLHKNMIWNIMINYRNAACRFSSILILSWVLFSIAENRLSDIIVERKFTSRIKQTAINMNIDKACWQFNDAACERFLFILLPPTMHCES